MIKEVLGIAAGGAVGSVSRFYVANGLYNWLGKDFPYGTLAVNVIGSFLMGFFAIILLDRMATYNAALAGFLLVGLFGGFTTFSTFSMDTVRLLFDGHYTLAAMNMLLSILSCVFVCMLGAWIAFKAFGIHLRTN